MTTALGISGLATDALADKVVVVTGGARGQGAAESSCFVGLGATVVIADLLEDQGTALATDLGDRAHFRGLDVTQPGEWESAVNWSTERFGRIDGLVNNAAIHWSRPLFEQDVTSFQSMLSVNLLGPFLGIQTVGRVMCELGGGSIVNVSSTAGLNGLPGHAAYGSAKWGLRGLSKTAAVELGPYGVRVNTIVPGPINTDMLRAGDEDRFARMPLRRAGEPTEVAPLVAFLLSDASSFITGAEVTVDGGASATLGVARQSAQPGGRAAT
jgi:3alpha(or 20beta)-hydroxysteroid dehydrogenase